jgi:hypothetical protein
MSKNIYPSRYSNGKTVSAAQYITELICEKKAKQDKLDLHYRFWLTPIWSKYFRNQIASANALLKKYSAKAVIKALQDVRTDRIYSLRAPHLLPIIDQYEAVVESENQEFTKTINRSDNTSFRKPQNKSNAISKLRKLDDES